MRLQLSEDQLLSRIRYFAYYELVSGVLMLGSILLVLSANATTNAKALAVFTGFLVLSGFIAYCGYTLLSNPQRGLRLSRIGLLPQVFGFSAGRMAFKFFPGIYALLSLNFNDEMNFSLNASISEFYVKLGTGAGWYFSLNLVALLLLRYTKKWLQEWEFRYSTPGQQSNEVY